SFNPDIAALHPPELLEFFPECGKEGLTFLIALRMGHQYPEPLHALALLRSRRERPCGRAAEQRDELAPPRVDHGGFLPRLGWAARNTHPPADGPTQSVCRTINLPHRGRQVLGPDLNRSESAQGPATSSAIRWALAWFRL